MCSVFCTRKVFFTLVRNFFILLNIFVIEPARFHVVMLLESTYEGLFSHVRLYQILEVYQTSPIGPSKISSDKRNSLKQAARSQCDALNSWLVLALLWDYINHIPKLPRLFKLWAIELFVIGVRTLGRGWGMASCRVRPKTSAVASAAPHTEHLYISVYRCDGRTPYLTRWR